MGRPLGADELTIASYLGGQRLMGYKTLYRVMSLWVHLKEGTGRRSLYLLDIPFELAFMLVGIAIVLLVVLLRRLF